MRRQVFDTKRRLTQKLKNAFEAPADALPGSLDDEYKNLKKNEIQELKKMLIRLSSAIKSHITAISAISDSSGMISSSMMELTVEQREHSSKGYVHSGVMQEASATMEVSGRTSLETLRDAHESLLRKIADFKTVEKQIAEYETTLLDVQAYERKYKDAEIARDAAMNSGKGGVEVLQAKVDKVTFKLSQSKAGYNSVKESLWGAFQWYQRAGGLLAAQEAEALRSAQLSFFEASAAALRCVPSYGPAELTADLNSCSDGGEMEYPPTDGGGGGQNAEESIFGNNLTSQDSENDLFNSETAAQNQEYVQSVEQVEEPPHYDGNPITSPTPPPPAEAPVEEVFEEMSFDNRPPPPPPPPADLAFAQEDSRPPPPPPPPPPAPPPASQDL